MIDQFTKGAKKLDCKVNEVNEVHASLSCPREGTITIRVDTSPEHPNQSLVTCVDSDNCQGLADKIYAAGK